jgi:hypothetical protein
MINNMAFINRWEKENLIITGVLLIALALRLYGIEHGLPYGYQIDEKFVVNHAMGFGTGDFNPHLFHWPGTSLMYFLFLEYGLLYVIGWLLGMFRSTADFAELFIRDPSVFYLIGRMTIAFMGTATVYLVYQLGRKVTSARVGLLASIFYGFSYLAVGIDHFIFPDTPLTFLSVLAMLLLHRILTHGEKRTYLWAGLVIGIALGTKYSGGALLIPLGLAHFYQVWSQDRKNFHNLFDKRIGIAILMIFIGFMLSCPFSLIDFQTFFRDLVWQFGRVHSGSFGTDVENGWIYYLIQGLPNSLGIGLAAVSILGVLYALLRHRGEEILITSFVLFYIGYIGSWKIGVDKYLLPILPFLTLLAASLIFGVLYRIERLSSFMKPLLILFVVLCISEPLARSVYNDFLLTQKDTRTIAKEWIEANLPPGTKIVLDAGNFDVAKMSPPLNDTQEGLMEKFLERKREISQTWASSKDQIDQYFQMKMKYAKGKSYHLIHIVPSLNGEIDRKISLEEFRKRKVDYIVVSSYAYGVYRDPAFRRRLPEVAQYYNNFYASLERHCELVRTFYPYSEKGPGPILRVYKVLYKAD